MKCRVKVSLCNKFILGVKAGMRTCDCSQQTVLMRINSKYKDICICVCVVLCVQ